MGASMSVEKRTDKEAFGAYVEYFLAPTLEPGHVWMMDRLRGRNPVDEASKREGCGGS